MEWWLGEEVMPSAVAPSASRIFIDPKIDLRLHEQLPKRVSPPFDMNVCLLF